jgi:hypothetical protein
MDYSKRFLLDARAQPFGVRNVLGGKDYESTGNERGCQGTKVN